LKDDLRESRIALIGGGGSREEEERNGDAN